MGNVFWVGAGGFVGAVFRYLLSGFVQHITQSAVFPHGTIAVNIIGCYVIGALSCMVDMHLGMAPHIRLFFMVGVLGSFTTYSTFSNETFALLQDQKYTLASINVIAHVLLGLGAVLLGRHTVFSFWR